MTFMLSKLQPQFWAASVITLELKHDNSLYCETQRYVVVMLWERLLERCRWHLVISSTQVTLDGLWHSDCSMVSHFPFCSYVKQEHTFVASHSLKPCSRTESVDSNDYPSCCGSWCLFSSSSSDFVTARLCDLPCKSCSSLIYLPYSPYVTFLYLNPWVFNYAWLLFWTVY